MRAIVTGAKGFVGVHLTEHLSQLGYEVIPYDLRDGNDLRDYEHLRNFIDLWRPDCIFHLAAQAYVPESNTNPRRTFEVNTLGSLNLLEAVRQLGVKPRIMLAGTSEEYGDSSVNEDSVLMPRSPYAVSKAAMDMLGEVYYQSYGIHIVVTRAFNHTGPGRGEMYAESSWAKQIAEIEKGKRSVIEHGNLSSIRNYTDVRDIVKAYAQAIDLSPNVYNICSTQNVTMDEVLKLLIKHAKVPVKIAPKSSLYRPNDFSFKKPSSGEFRSMTGWKSEIPLDKTLTDLLDYWRERI